MQEAAQADLQRFRAANPKATLTDVIRAWSRASNRDRYVAEILELQAAVRDVLAREEAAKRNEAAAKRERDLASTKLQALLDRMIGSGKADRRDGAELAVRALKGPGGSHLRQELALLRDAEIAGRPANSSSPLLQRARNQVGSWQSLHVLCETVSP
jgi:hypothetical protein